MPGGEEEKSKEGGSTATEEPNSSGAEGKGSRERARGRKVGGGGGQGVQLDSFSVRELLGPEKVDQEDVKLLREKVFGYTTFWVTGQEPFGDAREGVLLQGNLRGNREEVFDKLQQGLRNVGMGEKYDLFMLEEANAEEEDPRGGPRPSFVLLRK